MIAPSNKPIPPKSRPFGLRRIIALSCAVVAIAIIGFLCVSRDTSTVNDNTDRHNRKITSERRKSTKSDTQHSEKSVSENRALTPVVVEEPKTNQWGNPAHWGHKKLRPAMVHSIDRSQMPLFEQVFLNRADKTIAGLLVIEPGTDLIGDEVFDESFVRAFLKSIETPIIVSKDDDEETKALKRAVIETKIDLKARLDAGEDIAKTLTDIRRELRELGAYREELKQLVKEAERDHSMGVDDMKDFVKAANIMLEERGAKPIVMPEFYYHQLEIRNQKIKALKGDR